MCGKRLDLAGIQLGHLTVLEATDHRSSQGSIIWRCRCDCGNEILLPSSSIRNSHIADCGCRRSKRYANADITGQRFGRLTALYATDRRDNSGYKIWHCYCDCGNEIDVSYKALVYGNQQSCGCKKREHESELGTYLTHIDGTSIEALKSSKIPRITRPALEACIALKVAIKQRSYFRKNSFLSAPMTHWQKQLLPERKRKKC